MHMDGAMDVQQQVSETPEQVLQPATASRTVHRSTRSKDGCVTCKRRKVKCDEQRPWCSHCERLNLECKWHSQTSRRRSTATNSSERNPVTGTGTPISTTPGTGISPNATLIQPHHAVNQIFDYASFMWEGGDAWQQVSESGPNVNFDAQIMDTAYEVQIAAQGSDASPGISFNATRSVTDPSEPSTVPDTGAVSDQDFAMHLPADNHRLMDYFIHAVTPPILAEVETQKKWFAMRQNLVKMANASRMVRWAVLAFSNIMLCRRDGAWMASPRNHYDNATAEVVKCDEDLDRENLLATLFFLSYVDILEGRIEAAHSSLKRAYGIFQQGQQGSFTTPEKQFLLWLRLLDARAVSAGGEGLFLSKDDEALLVQASPASLAAEKYEGGYEDSSEGDIEDVLFQVLYQPGIMFFQKTLHEQRPLLMDYAVAGKLTAPHVSAHLAFTITRAFRTYLANFYASKIHLHRVAYKMFPLTTEALDAVNQIRRLTKLITDSSDGEDALPVNMLWPLLMWGSEEQDAEERVWIKSQILRMEKVAGNARITAQVLEEVQARQDASKLRVDIRSVMHAIFNSSFAIV
ncbi:hypothetical protein BJ170DRAFT_598322 [Xylariales sp. AK1849]|nr:hypothetical protein BJ170DRAFT_598322 [Xylariales sp. AK1849]